MAKKKRQFHAENMAAQDEEDDGLDADDDFEDDAGVPPVAVVDTPKVDYEAIVDGIHADTEMRSGDEGGRETRMKMFLADPVTSMKVFLSSHYLEKGLIW